MRPSRKQLFARLRKIEGVRSWGELARRLDLDERRLTAWRGGKGLSYEKTVELLDRAGYLREDGAGANADAETVALLGELEVEIASVFQRLRQRLGHQEHDESHG